MGPSNARGITLAIDIGGTFTDAVLEAGGQRHAAKVLTTSPDPDRGFLESADQVLIFPFNLQNYAYGVTRIGFWAYLTTSAVCMIPATVAYTFAGGALSRGGGDFRWTLGYLADAGVLIVLVSLLPRYLERRNRTAGALLNRAILLPLLTVLGVGPHPGPGSDATSATAPCVSSLPRHGGGIHRG